ncbi:hypothetical protein [Paraglaciecola sp.]|uniref:hypothetical protein n=1 Tax=Paraglaciecola sp. TaxID=1920173 RepID=UPI003EF2F9ED
MRTNAFTSFTAIPCGFSGRIPAARFTFYQQPQKVNKKGRAPDKFFNLRDLPNRGRKEMFPTYFAKMTSLSFGLYLSTLLGELEFAVKLKLGDSFVGWPIGHRLLKANKIKAATTIFGS